MEASSEAGEILKPRPVANLSIDWIFASTKASISRCPRCFAEAISAAMSTLSAIPAKIGLSWRRCMDSALPSPDDIQPLPQAPQVAQAAYTLQARSMVVLALTLQQTPDNF